MLLYCSTVGEGDGGETDFPLLGVKVRPVLGRAVFWPNVYAHTLVRDVRTMHASLLLHRGVKHAVNLNVYSARHARPTGAWAAMHFRFFDWVSGNVVESVTRKRGSPDEPRSERRDEEL